MMQSPFLTLDCGHFFFSLLNLASVPCMSKVVKIRPLAEIILSGCVPEIQKCCLVNDTVIDQGVIITF